MLLCNLLYLVLYTLNILYNIIIHVFKFYCSRKPVHYCMIDILIKKAQYWIFF